MRIPSSLLGLPWHPAVGPLVSRAVYVELAQSLVCKCPPGTAERRCRCTAKPSEFSKRWSTRWLSEKVLLATHSEHGSAGIDRFKSGKRVPGPVSLAAMQAAAPHSQVTLWGNHPLWHLLAPTSDHHIHDVVHFALGSISGPLRAEFWRDVSDDYAPWDGCQAFTLTAELIERSARSEAFYQLTALDQIVCSCALARQAEILQMPSLAKEVAQRSVRPFERALFDHHQLYATWPLIERLMNARYWNASRPSIKPSMALLSTRTREQLQPKDGTGVIELPSPEVVKLASLSASEAAALS
jgi:hypothetical protein